MNAIKERKIVYTSGQIAERVRAMAAEIDAFYGDEPLVAVCVLKGAVFFFTDLVRAMRSENLELDFVRLSSYGKGTSSSSHVVFSKDVDCDITGKHVLILAASITTGYTMQAAIEAVNYYGGQVAGLSAIFATTHECMGYPVTSIFDPASLPDYASYDSRECPLCKNGQKIDALVNSFGYSAL